MLENFDALEDLGTLLPRVPVKDLLRRLLGTRRLAWNADAANDALVQSFVDSVAEETWTVLRGPINENIARKSWIRLRAYRVILHAWCFPSVSRRHTPLLVHRVNMMLGALAGVSFFACHRGGGRVPEDLTRTA